jgi:hypothetical protein
VPILTMQLVALENMLLAKYCTSMYEFSTQKEVDTH